MIQVFPMLVHKCQMVFINELTFDNKTTVVEKVTIYKSHGEVPLLEQDKIEYVS